LNEISVIDCLQLDQVVIWDHRSYKPWMAVNWHIPNNMRFRDKSDDVIRFTLRVLRYETTPNKSEIKESICMGFRMGNIRYATCQSWVEWITWYCTCSS
jgi:hypothetical protein